MCGDVHAVCDKASSTCIATGFIPDDLVRQETFPTMCLSIVCPTAPPGVHMGKRRGFDSVLNGRHVPPKGREFDPALSYIDLWSVNE